MRIEANLEHPKYKITVFHSNQRLILKLENSQGAFDLKLPQFQVHELSRLKKYLGSDFFQKTDQIFSLVQDIQNNIQRSQNENETIIEDEII